MMSSCRALVLLALTLPFALSCDFHANHQRHPHLGRTRVKRADGRSLFDWDYRTSFDWHTIKPEYRLCHSGTTQSPIDLQRAEGLAHTHRPDFSAYGEEVSGNFFNWGFGPAYTLHHKGEDFTSLPTLKFDEKTVYLSGWHIHTPSEHLVDGVRSRAEMHFVHVDEKGKAASVVGMRIDVHPESEYKSAFFDSVEPSLVGFNHSAVLDGVSVSPISAIKEAGGLNQYWTYRGSLTTPPCSEGLRWFVAAQPLFVAKEQMVALLDSGRFSHRVEQAVWEHAINV